jgi:hypothetical protein
MRIHLLGDYSNVHWTLAQGLRACGHEATVVSDGDGWKNYPRDIDLKRRSLRPADTLRYYLRCWHTLSRLRGYDVVQLINPVFLDLRAQRIPPFYRLLRKHNRRLFLGAFGMDHYWVKTCLDGTTFRYSDFNIGTHLRTDEPCNKDFIRDWLDGEKTQLNIDIANAADGIISGLYEYDRCYRPVFPDKTTFIPFPIDCSQLPTHRPYTPGSPIRFFAGVQKSRSAYKGTDIMLRALHRVQEKHPHRCEIVHVENVPFEQYKQLMADSDVILDQLYSYTPAMNALQAMAQGLIVVGGGEPENYSILGEQELRPIVNVQPDEEDCFRQMEDLVLHPERIPLLSRQSVEYIKRHHDHVRVARKYLEAWQQTMD